MDLYTIKQYSHRIDKIIITNDNLYSLYSEIIFKVNLDDKHIQDNEIVRFSLEPNDNFIQHQRFDNDYYFRIPNILKKNANDDNVIYVYAHYFPSDLYDYDEDAQLFSIYDFRELLDEHPIDHYYGDPYEVQINQEKYEWHVDEEGRLVVQSLLKDSVNRYNDPNYKNYIQDDASGNNMTKKGMFPLSSKYRSKQNWTAPNLQEEYPLWNEETYQRNKMPFWEARINRTGLSPLITNGLENQDYDAFPLNVYLNYEYLPTTREYHQHYYGFEPTENECKTINVFEGTNINTLDDKFGSDNNYRLITRDNPYDDKRSMYVPHGYEIPLSFNNFTYNNSDDRLKKNSCYNFWVYNSKANIQCGQDFCSQRVYLTEGDYYSLRFYMYIPSYTELNQNCQNCYVTVTANPDDKFTYWEDYNDDMIQYDTTTRIEEVDHTATYKINDAFLQKDKTMRNQWIYHEIPFKAGRENDIKIYGPQLHKQDEDNPIFFTRLSLLKMEEYSPTLKYTNTGLYVVEKDQYTFKPNSEEICDPVSIDPDDKKWIDSEEELPRPYNQVYMVLDHETYIEYDDRTSNLYFVHNDNEMLQIEHRITDDTDEIAIIYDPDDCSQYDTKCWYNDDITDNTDDSQRDTNLYASYKDHLVLVRGTNNKINIKIQDIMGNPIDTGSVSASIMTVENKETNGEHTEKDLKERPVVNGKINWFGIDLTDLTPSTVVTEIGEQYYLRLVYNNPCYNKPYIDFKPFYVVKEQVDMIVEINGKRCVDNQGKLINRSNRNNIPGQSCWIEAELNDSGEIINFPIVIKAYIEDQLNQSKTDGYCELSINDRVVQTTMVDLDGKADFYLDLEDIHINCQTLKIEYYRQYDDSIVFKYFNLCIDPNIDLRPAVPIEIKMLRNGSLYTIQNSCTIDQDDVCLCCVSSNYHNDFGLKIEEKIDNGEWTTFLHETVHNPDTEYTFLDAPYDSNEPAKTITYRITTGNKIDSNGNEIDDKYRSYSRTFKVIRQNIYA